MNAMATQHSDITQTATMLPNVGTEGRNRETTEGLVEGTIPATPTAVRGRMMCPMSKEDRRKGGLPPQRLLLPTGQNPNKL